MERQLKAGIAILMISYFGACAPVSFDTVAANKGDNVTTRCVGSTCYYDVVEEKTVGEGLVDILIVNDNSGSMSFEQNKMAAAFTGFLTSIDKFDYRIAMITTDASSGNNPASPYNGNGALQDGKLIEFSPGQKYLERATYNKDTLFNQTIKRPETVQCESSGFTQCPAGDERPIVTMGLSIKNYMSQWTRPTAHLAIIVLSDEDERSVSKYNPCAYYATANERSNCEAVKAAFPFEAADEPQAVVDSFRGLYPSKTMSIHSIIVKPITGANDTAGIACRNAQTNQVPATPPVLGFEGYAMAKLSGLTGGVVGDICASNYTNQLKTIGDALGAKVPSLPFRCRPLDDKYTVTFTNTSTGVVTTAPASSYTADYITTMTLTVNATLDPLTKVSLAYTCTK